MTKRKHCSKRQWKPKVKLSRQDDLYGSTHKNQLRDDYYKSIERTRLEITEAEIDNLNNIIHEKTKEAE